jgi:hypothetical protein
MIRIFCDFTRQIQVRILCSSVDILYSANGESTILLLHNVANCSVSESQNYCYPYRLGNLPVSHVDMNLTPRLNERIKLRYLRTKEGASFWIQGKGCERRLDRTGWGETSYFQSTRNYGWLNQEWDEWKVPQSMEQAGNVSLSR